MELSYLIIDDFLKDPDAVRNHALGLDYPTPTGTHYYPGKMSEQRFALPNIDQIISQLVHEPVRGLNPKDPQNHHCRVRLTLDGEEGLKNVHIDQCHWSGLLYLSREEDCTGGTDFFRHKATGSDRAPLTLQEMQEMGFKDASDVWQNLIHKDSNREEAWEHRMRIPMKYNRLVLLRPYFWHAPTPGFGKNLQDGRLVYLLFFEALRQ